MQPSISQVSSLTQRRVNEQGASPMTKQFKVLRHFKVDGAMRKPGDLLEVASVKNPQALIDQRYIVDASDDSTSFNPGGPTPDPKIAQDRMVEQAAGRQGGPENDVADDDPITSENEEENGALAKPSQLRGSLPDDFPGHKPLTEAGFNTYAKVRKQLDNLEDVDGIGKATADRIRAEFANEDAGGDDDSEPGDSTVPKAPNV